MSPAGGSPCARLDDATSSARSCRVSPVMGPTEPATPRGCGRSTVQPAATSRAARAAKAAARPRPRRPRPGPRRPRPAARLRAEHRPARRDEPRGEVVEVRAAAPAVRGDDDERRTHAVDVRLEPDAALADDRACAPTGGGRVHATTPGASAGAAIARPCDDLGPDLGATPARPPCRYPTAQTSAVGGPAPRA